MPERLHPIKLEIYRNLYTSIAEEMGTNLRRTAYSPNIKERRDYSCALFDGQGEVVAMGDHMPVHLGSMPLSVRAAIQAAPMLPGDIVFLNDPYSGGTHLPDVTLIAPVYSPSHPSRPFFYVASRAHHSDVGGLAPGSMPLSSNIFQEGIRVPPLKLYESGRLNRSLLRLLLHNVRTPTEREGDLAAQVGSLRIGERRLLRLVKKSGTAELKAYMEGLQDYGERVTRNIIAGIPKGQYTAEDFLDEGGADHQSGRRPLKIRVKVTIIDEKMSVDFTGSAPQVEGCMNAVEAIAVSAVYYVLRCLAPHDAPTSGGVIRPVQVIAPLGTVVNASYPAATAGGNVETSQRIVDVILRALASALPDRIPSASSGTMNNLCLGGIQPVTGQPFSYYETIGGGMGASPTADGDSGVHTHMTNSMNTPIEALERHYPVRIREYRLRRDSGGRGKFSGGQGIVRTLEILKDCEVTMLSDRRRHAPYGLRGGRAGRRGENFLIVNNRRKRLPGKFSLSLSRGQILCVKTPGGGGWGTAKSALRERVEQSASP